MINAIHCDKTIIIIKTKCSQDDEFFVYAVTNLCMWTISTSTSA